MIPKIVHYCWFGQSMVSPLIEDCIASWRKNLPDYQFILWNESNCQFDTPFLEFMYKKRRWAFVSDYMRLRVLHGYGGVYLDTDIEVVKNFDPLVSKNCDAFLGYESLGRANTAVIGSKKKGAYVECCMKMIDDRFKKKMPYLIAPEVATEVLLTGKIEDVICYGQEYFYPYNPYDKSRKVQILMAKDITENTYAIHHWGKTWSIPIHERISRKILSLLRI